MSYFAADIPEVVVKPGKMLNYWSTKAKVGAILLALALYVYFLIFVKNIYLKHQKLENLKAMASETEMMIHKLHVLDANLAFNIEQLDAVLDAGIAE